MESSSSGSSTNRLPIEQELKGPGTSVSNKVRVPLYWSKGENIFSFDLCHSLIKTLNTIRCSDVDFAFALI